MWGFCAGSWRLWQRFLVSLCMPNGKAWAATYRNHLGGSSPLGWLVKKKESYKRSSCPHSVLFGCGIHLIAVEMLIWLGTLCKTQISNIKQIVYTWKPSKLSWLEDTLFQPTYTPRRQMGPSTYMFFKKKHVTTSKLKHNKPLIFSSCIPTYKKKTAKKNTTQVIQLDQTIFPFFGGHDSPFEFGSRFRRITWQSYVYPMVFHDPVIPVAFGECSSVYLHVP